jgi:hypothetical protein
MAARIVHPTYAPVLPAWTGQDEATRPVLGAPRRLGRVACCLGPRAARATSRATGRPERWGPKAGRCRGKVPTGTIKKCAIPLRPRVRAGSQRTVCPNLAAAKPRLTPGLAAGSTYRVAVSFRLAGPRCQKRSMRDPPRARGRPRGGSACLGTLDRFCSDRSRMKKSSQPVTEERQAVRTAADAAPAAGRQPGVRL